MTERLAVLVDGDNISASHADRILKTAEQNGRADVARVYLNAQVNSGWLTAPGYRVMHAGVGKNAADVLLSIDAIELAVAGEVTDFVIATSDGDFTHLALRLREWGAQVTGLGEAKAPDNFRAACSRFVEVTAPACRVEVSVNQSLAARQAANDPTVNDALPCVSELDLKIRTIIAIGSKAGKGIRISELAPQMHQQHGVKISKLPERTWRAYLSKRPALYALEPRGPEAKVRFLPEGFADA
ncbi:NYN domain-containing protein [Actibacterium ureilyticum]|uniref:NYN domain-containing protein n=1 Tax=Actibacterium ureilyticum TaxID=1590614 RepID=UPI000BAAD16C|nr:NYN domain-containing protein [Actibacterium ureilyticum]